MATQGKGGPTDSDSCMVCVLPIEAPTKFKYEVFGKKNGKEIVLHRSNNFEQAWWVLSTHMFLKKKRYQGVHLTINHEVS